MPAGIEAGDLALLVMVTTVSGTQTVTCSNTITFDNWVTVQAGADTSVRIQAKRRVCTGTEDSTGVLVQGVGASGRNAAQVYVFRGDSSLWNFEGPSGAEFAFAQQNAQVQTNIGVSTSGAERLLLNIWGINQKEAAPSVMTNDTGGTWNTAGYYTPTVSPSITIQLFVASLTTSGSISNGVATLSAANICNKIGVALWNTQVAQPLTVTAGAFADLVLYGNGPPIIAPVWG